MYGRIFGTVTVLNLVCIFSLKGSSSIGQPPVSHGAYAASAKPVGATFHHEKRRRDQAGRLSRWESEADKIEIQSHEVIDFVKM